MVRRCLVAFLVASCLLACQSSDPPPQTQPPSSGPSAACGIQLFANPGCQAALDQGCCPLENDCARDPGCTRIVACISGCKGKGDNCTNGCALQSQHDYCAALCAGKGNDCPNACLLRRDPGSPYMRYALLASCSKDVRYPADAHCSGQD